METPPAIEHVHTTVVTFSPNANPFSADAQEERAGPPPAAAARPAAVPVAVEHESRSNAPKLPPAMGATAHRMCKSHRSPTYPGRHTHRPSMQQPPTQWSAASIAVEQVPLPRGRRGDANVTSMETLGAAAEAFRSAAEAFGALSWRWGEGAPPIVTRLVKAIPVPRTPRPRNRPGIARP